MQKFGILKRNPPEKTKPDEKISSAKEEAAGIPHPVITLGASLDEMFEQRAQDEQGVIHTDEHVPGQESSQ